MGVFLTLHREEMCLLDVYVQSKRQDNINMRNPLQRLNSFTVIERKVWVSHINHIILCFLRITLLGQSIS